MKNDNHIWYIMMILWYNNIWYYTISINKCLPMSTSLPPRRLPWLGALLRPRCRRPWPVWPSWRCRRPRPAGRCEAYFVCKICKNMWIPAISLTYHVNPCKIRLESKISKQKKKRSHNANWPCFQHLPTSSSPHTMVSFCSDTAVGRQGSLELFPRAPRLITLANASYVHNLRQGPFLWCTYSAITPNCRTSETSWP